MCLLHLDAASRLLKSFFEIGALCLVDLECPLCNLSLHLPSFHREVTGCTVVALTRLMRIWPKRLRRKWFFALESRREGEPYGFLHSVGTLALELELGHVPL